jgi:hypothetical protein
MYRSKHAQPELDRQATRQHIITFVMVNPENSAIGFEDDTRAGSHPQNRRRQLKINPDIP